ncbi:MAG: DUF4258 domain-containing protein [Deltaproteobacteria bacterium]|nr:DUF4258 domain-containing protein [Deltaproteobacteria bacterium]MBI4374110.1 DUF4258 domain-containing protein [Deltaproteobacteria bacterium]
MKQKIRLHPHAEQRLSERGATKDEVLATVQSGEKFPAKFDRVGFRRNFAFGGPWRGRQYKTKQVEAYAVHENEGWLVLTVMVKYF